MMMSATNMNVPGASDGYMEQLNQYGNNPLQPPRQSEMSPFGALANAMRDRLMDTLSPPTPEQELPPQLQGKVFDPIRAVSPTAGVSPQAEQGSDMLQRALIQDQTQDPWGGEHALKMKPQWISRMPNMGPGGDSQAKFPGPGNSMVGKYGGIERSQYRQAEKLANYKAET